MYFINTDNSYYPNSLYREVYETTFSDNSKRKETIVADTLNPTLALPNITFFSEFTKDFYSAVEYSQRTFDTEFDFSSVRINGTRYYANNDVTKEERIYIEEEGQIINIVVNGVERGRSNVSGTMYIIIKDRSLFSITGEYVFETPSGIFTYTVTKDDVSLSW